MHRLYTLILTALLPLSLAADIQYTIHGSVFSRNGYDPLVGASVIVKGTTQGTIADIDGHFELDCHEGDTILISYVGYHSQMIVVDCLQPVVYLGEKTDIFDTLVVSRDGVKRRPISRVDKRSPNYYQPRTPITDEVREQQRQKMQADSIERARHIELIKTALPLDSDSCNMYYLDGADTIIYHPCWEDWGDDWINEEFIVVEQEPTFLGGDKALYRYFTENLRYPDNADQGGTCVMAFEIGRDGRIDRVERIKSSGNNALDSEVARVLLNMPDWKPGMQRGKAVRVTRHLTVFFRPTGSAPAPIVTDTVEPEPEPIDWAGYERYAWDNEQLRRAPDAVFIGCDITDKWVELRPEWFAEHRIAARGIRGQTSAEMLCRFRADVIELHPRKVHIMAGLNDIKGLNGQISLRHTADQILSMAQLALINGIEPYVGAVLPVRNVFWTATNPEPSEDIIALNQMLSDDADQYGYHFIDYYPYFVERDTLDKGREKLQAQYCRLAAGTELSEQGYDLLQHLAPAAIGETATLSLTFDDGLREHGTLVWPLLKRYGLRATFYIVSEHIDQGTVEEGARPMSWNMIGRMSAQGQTIGNHSASHPHLNMLPLPEVEREILTCDSAIFAHTGVSTTRFAYPYHDRTDGTDHLIRSLLAQRRGSHREEGEIRSGIFISVGGQEYPTVDDAVEMVRTLVAERRHVTLIIHGITEGWDAWEDDKPFRAMMAEIAAQVKQGNLIVMP